jgi:hypothetical protein
MSATDDRTWKRPLIVSTVRVAAPRTLPPAVLSGHNEQKLVYVSVTLHHYLCFVCAATLGHGNSSQGAPLVTGDLRIGRLGARRSQSRQIAYPCRCVVIMHKHDTQHASLTSRLLLRGRSAAHGPSPLGRAPSGRPPPGPSRCSPAAPGPW